MSIFRLPPRSRNPQKSIPVRVRFHLPGRYPGWQDWPFHLPARGSMQWLFGAACRHDDGACVPLRGQHWAFPV